MYSNAPSISLPIYGFNAIQFQWQNVNSPYRYIKYSNIKKNLQAKIETQHKGGKSHAQNDTDHVKCGQLTPRQMTHAG